MTRGITIDSQFFVANIIIINAFFGECFSTINLALPKISNIGSCHMHGSAPTVEDVNLFKNNIPEEFWFEYIVNPIIIGTKTGRDKKIIILIDQEL